MAKRSRTTSSTGDVTVFGWHRPEPLANEIWYGRANRKSILSAYLQLATEDEKKDFFKHFCMLQDILFAYLDESERVLLLFDNSTIQDVLQQDEAVRRRSRYNSLLALLIQAEDYHLVDVFAAITPVILYEINGCRPIQDSTTWSDIRSKITHAMAALGLDVTYVGFRNFNQLFHTHKEIVEDEKQIRHALEIIRTRNWSLDPVSLGSEGTAIGLSIAEE
jgi:hypothetical protein